MSRTLRGVRAGAPHRPVDVTVAGGLIAAITPADDDGDGPLPTVVPGFVDLHVHGGGGASFDALDAAEIRAAAAYHHRHGTTTMLASLVTAPSERLRRSCALLGGLTADGVVAGVHLEGPFLSARRCGAQDPQSIVPPDVGLLERLWEDAAGHLAMVTVACEHDGALDVIGWCVAHDVIAAIGHTDADVETTQRAIDAGATVATHLFNAMPPLHHRAPGAAGALLADPRVTCELIFDGDHIAPTVAAIVVAAAGPGRVAAVTDAISASGLADGRHTLGGLDVDVRAGVARLADNGALAGSTTTMDASLRQMVSWGVPLPAALTMCSSTPAGRLGVDADLRPGAPADLVVLDADLRVAGVLRGGVPVPDLPLSAGLAGGGA